MTNTTRPLHYCLRTFSLGLIPCTNSCTLYLKPKMERESSRLTRRNLLNPFGPYTSMGSRPSGLFILMVQRRPGNPNIYKHTQRHTRTQIHACTHMHIHIEYPCSVYTRICKQCKHTYMQLFPKQLKASPRIYIVIVLSFQSD